MKPKQNKPAARSIFIGQAAPQQTRSIFIGEGTRPRRTPRTPVNGGQGMTAARRGRKVQDKMRPASRFGTMKPKAPKMKQLETEIIATTSHNGQKHGVADFKDNKLGSNRNRQHVMDAVKRMNPDTQQKARIEALRSIGLNRARAHELTNGKNAGAASRKLEEPKAQGMKLR